MFDVPDVAEAVPLAAFLGIEVVEQIVVGDRAERTDAMADGGASEEWRFDEADLRIEAEDFAGLDEARGFDDAVGGEEVEAAESVVVAEDAPGGFGGASFLRGSWSKRGMLFQSMFFIGARPVYKVCSLPSFPQRLSKHGQHRHIFRVTEFFLDRDQGFQIENPHGHVRFNFHSSRM